MRARLLRVAGNHLCARSCTGNDESGDGPLACPRVIAAARDRFGGPSAVSFLAERGKRASGEGPGRLWPGAIASGTAFGSGAHGRLHSEVAHAQVASKGLAAFWTVCAARGSLEQIVRFVGELRICSFQPSVINSELRQEFTAEAAFGWPQI